MKVILDLEEAEYLIRRLEHPENCGQSPEWDGTLRESVLNAVMIAVIQAGENTDKIPKKDIERLRKELS